MHPLGYDVERLRMSKRININEALEHLERAALRDRDLDREVASDWFAVDSEAWLQLDTVEPQPKAAGRGVARSTSRRSIRR